MRPRIALSTFPILIAIAIALVMHAARTNAYEHAANGGFEQGLDGWTIAPNVSVGIATADETGPAEGSTSARVTLDGNVATLRYPLEGALAAGSYTLGIQAHSLSQAANVAVFLQPADPGQQRVDAGSRDLAAEWTDVSGTFLLPQAMRATITVLVAGPPGSVVYLDDLQLDGASPVTLTPTSSAPPQTATTSASGTPPSGGSSTPTIVPTATVTIAADAIGPALRNASFEQIDESGAPIAWEKYGGTIGSDERSRSGTRASRLTSDTVSTKWLHQAVTVDPAHWYAFEAWLVHDDPGLAAAFLRVSWYASSDASGRALDTADSTTTLDRPARDYRLLTTGAIQSPPDAHSARVRIMLAPVSGATATILADDAWFGEVDHPPPVTLTPAASVTPGPIQAVVSSDGAPPDGVRGSTSSSVRSINRAPALLGASANGTLPSIVINEVLYDADSDVPDADAEWLELYNNGETPIDVVGWTLRDAASIDELPSLVVPPRGFAIIAATAAFNDAYPHIDAPVAIIGGRIGNALGNDGDRLLLFDPAGAVVDAVSWGADGSVLDPSVSDVPSGHSIERRSAGVDSDRAADFVDNQRPSPGASYEAAGANPKQRNGSGSVDILAGSGERDWSWLPWALVAVSGAACAATAGWRGVWFARDRLRRP